MPDWRRQVGQHLEGLGLAPMRVEEIVEELGQHLEDRFRELRAAGATDSEAERTVLDNRPASIIGVMPAGFGFPPRAQLWMPLPIDPQALDCWCWETMGRLGSGRAPEDASRELASLNDDFWRERNPGQASSTDSRSVVVVTPLARLLTGEVRTPLLVLLAAVGMVLLIACANIANLLLARATARSREIALRCCLGASPWRIVRQLLVESLLLGALGMAAGLAVAAWAVQVLGRLALEPLSQQRDLALDGTVLAFTAAAGLAAVMLFGLAPALRGARVDVHEAVKDGTRGTRGKPTRRLNDAFVVSQFALSLVLLVGAGLRLRSFDKLLAVDPGFRPENVLVGRMARPDQHEAGKALQFFLQFDERLRALPGVRSAGLSSAALVLSAVGIYGVMALSVSHRVNEFGIRLALGAEPGDVRALVLGQAMRLVLVAVALGLAGAAAVARLLASLLFQVKPMDPLTFGGVALGLAAVALAACYIPARRATATDPLTALRYE